MGANGEDLKNREERNRKLRKTKGTGSRVWGKGIQKDTHK